MREPEFLEALAFAQVYLSAEDDKTLRMAMSACRRAQTSLYHALPDSEFPQGRPHAEGFERAFPWVEFADSHYAAVAVFARLLNPPSLRYLEGSLGEKHDLGGTEPRVRH